MSDKGLISKNTKNPYNLSNKKIITLIKAGKIFDQTLPRRYSNANRHIKKVQP